jgi:hypothetical protein
MAAKLHTIYHRSLAGRVTAIDLLAEEAACAIAAAPDEWALGQRQFAPWPADQVRGDPVPDPTIAGSIPANKVWEIAE